MHSYTEGLKVESEDRNCYGEVVRVLDTHYVVVQWHDGQLRDEHVTDLKIVTQPQFKPGDRCFSHYVMKWGTVKSLNHTRRNERHGVTGQTLPDTSWYNVALDNGETIMLDDAHGDWEMARIVPPHIAQRYGYGSDPRAA